MRVGGLLRGGAFQVAPWLLVVALLLPAVASAQEEVTSSVRRYKDREASTGYYEEHEAKPRRQRPARPDEICGVHIPRRLPRRYEQPLDVRHDFGTRLRTYNTNPRAKLRREFTCPPRPAQAFRHPAPRPQYSRRRRDSACTEVQSPYNHV